MYAGMYTSSRNRPLTQQLCDWRSRGGCYGNCVALLQCRKKKKRKKEKVALGERRDPMHGGSEPFIGIPRAASVVSFPAARDRCGRLCAPSREHPCQQAGRSRTKGNPRGAANVEGPLLGLPTVMTPRSIVTRCSQGRRWMCGLGLHKVSAGDKNGPHARHRPRPRPTHRLARSAEQPGVTLFARFFLFPPTN